jgi:hypothetical protein
MATPTNDELANAQIAIEKSLSEKVPFVAGTGAPVSTPYFAGQMYYDIAATANDTKWYFSHDNGGGLEWLELATEGGNTTVATWYQLTGFISDANAAPPTFNDGEFYLMNYNTGSPNGGWGSLPPGLEDGDIIKRETGAWVLEVDISAQSPNSVIAEFDDLWAVILGTNGWLNIPEYNPSLDDNITTQAALGGFPAGTKVSDLRYKTWGTIINELVFPVTLPVYVIPTITTSDDMFKERGKDLSGILSFTFNIGDAANATTSVVDFEDNLGGNIWSNPVTPGTGTFVHNVDLDDDSYDVIADPDAGEHVVVRFTVNYGQGNPKNDSHNNPDVRTPSSGGDGPVAASSVDGTVEYGSLYPFWTVASSDPALDPGDPGNAAAAPVLTETWIRNNMTQALFNEDGNNSETVPIPVPAGSEYVIALCPPTFGVTSAEDTKYGFSYDAMVTQTDTISINDAEGANPVTYNIHFFRNVSVGGWAENQDITVVGRIISTTSTYEILEGSPIDNRFTAPTNADRDAMPSSYRYEGLIVYVADPNGDSSVSGRTYQLVGGITNLDWQEIKTDLSGVTNDTFIIDGNTGVGTGVVEIGGLDADDLQVYEITHNLGKILTDIKVDIYLIEDTSASPVTRIIVAADSVYTDISDPSNKLRIRILPPGGALERIEIILHSV